LLQRIVGIKEKGTTVSTRKHGKCQNERPIEATRNTVEGNFSLSNFFYFDFFEMSLSLSLAPSH
jgi:hypothetical protein